MDYVLQLKNVRKDYHRLEVLKPLDLGLKSGEIYGLVGENGAGKSTLIRIIMGLARPTMGSVSLFGVTARKEVRKQRSRLGYVPDVNALQPNMSARENLEIRRIEWGIKNKDCIDNTLDLVGLSPENKKKVRLYSLGMRRRLDLAVALLGNPELLILDEPTNGLDPMGIIEVRKLLKRLNSRYGVTVLISSHILAELHETATQYLFLSHGQMLKQISANDLDRQCGRALILNVDRVDESERLLRSELHVDHLEIVSKDTIRLRSFLDRPHEVNKLLVDRHIAVKQIFIEEDNLETYYAQLIASARVQ